VAESQTEHRTEIQKRYRLAQFARPHSNMKGSHCNVRDTPGGSELTFQSAKFMWVIFQN